MVEQTIKPLETDMTWFDGFNATKAKGGMPTNAEHDEILMDDAKLAKVRSIRSSYYSARCKE